MNDINRIGIRIVSIVIVVVMILFGIWQGITFAISQLRTSNPTPLPSTAPTIAASPLAEEPLSPDTARKLTELADSARQTLTGYTKQYVESLPANSTQEQVLDQQAIENFVNANRGALLPELPEGTVQVSTKTGKQAISDYLDAIAASHNTAIASVTGDTIIAALAKQESGEDPQALLPVRKSIEGNLNIFKSIQAPKEAEALHTKLIQATQALLTSVGLLQNMSSDFVGGLIGQKNLADLNTVFADISEQIRALETKYDLE